MLKLICFMTDQPVGVHVIVFDPSGKRVLLGRRKNAYKAGWYGMPGGRLDKNESLADCCRRELREETGIHGEVEYLGVVREYQEDKQWNYVHFTFVCRKFSGEPKLMEPEKCKGWGWFDMDKLPEKMLQGHKAGIEMLKSSRKRTFIDLT